MEKNQVNESKLTAEEITEFKSMLLAKRNELLGNVTSMENGTLRQERSDLSNLPIHMADAGSDNYEIENTLGLVDSERKILKQVNEALERIKAGVYGICEGTGKLIPKARLEAIPWAKYCVEYASTLEKGEGRNNHSWPSVGYDYGVDDQDSEDAFERRAI